ncbi:unnamed protein product, partial [Pylaiella littoralis]
MPMGAINFAALRGDNDIMIALFGKIEGGKTDLVEYALILACRRGHLGMVKILFENGGQAKIRQHDFDQPLICATEGGHDAIVTLLLGNGADPNEKRMDGDTPLTMAAFCGHVRTTKTLMDASAKDERALDHAFLGKHIPVVNAILDYEACDDKELLGEYLASTANTYCEDKPEYRYEALLMLLHRGAPVNTETYCGTPLHRTMRNEDCSEAIVNLLLRWGADETMKDRRGTPADVLASNSRLAPAVAERVRQLLHNAPKDRAWRRRGWLVMLRARTLKAGEAVVITEPKNSRGRDG